MTRKSVKCETQFFRIQIEFSQQMKDFSALSLKCLILNAVRSMFGNNGVAQWPVDILQYSQETGHGIIACSSRGSVQVRAALTLCGRLKEHPNVKLRVNFLQTSPFLNGLGSDARRWMAEL
eukprot:189742_1